MVQGWPTFFFLKGPQLLSWAGLQAACVKITKSGIPHCLNYCTNFTVQMQFTNVAVGRITQPGMPHMPHSPHWTHVGG
jgi:hypothetical protein